MYNIFRWLDSCIWYSTSNSINLYYLRLIECKEISLQYRKRKNVLQNFLVCWARWKLNLKHSCAEMSFLLLFIYVTNEKWYISHLSFFSEVSSSQVNFFKMLDEKIENVSLYKICFNNHFDHFTSIFCPNSIILELHGMHFKLSAHCFYQTISQCISNKSNHWSLKYKFESYFFLELVKKM